MDYKAYAAVDRTSLLEILIARGLFVQAMAVISEFGYEGLRTESLLKLTSRMLIRCHMAEDEELLALASDIYRHGKYDEVILKYLMDFRFGPVNEMLSVWKSAQGFEMDTYDLDEKLLELLMFTSDYRKEGEKILEDYVKHTGKESVVSAYLTQELQDLNVDTVRQDIPTSSTVTDVKIWDIKQAGTTDFTVVYSIDQTVTEGETSIVYTSAYMVVVHVDGDGNLVIIQNPTISSIPTKSSYEPKAQESDGTVDAATTEEVTEFLETFFKLYPTATEKELAYYVSGNVLKPVNCDYVFSELVNPIFIQDGEQIKASISVKYLDQRTKATQISQFDLTLEKDSNWKIVK